MSNTAPTLSKPAAIRRMRYAIQAIALLFAATAVCAFVAILGDRFPHRLDATATREHHLSARTTELLNSLQGPYEMVVAANFSMLDQASARRTQDVLDNFARTTPNIRTTIIDVSSSRGLADLDALLARLVERFKPEMEKQQKGVAAAMTLAGPLNDSLNALSKDLLAAKDTVLEGDPSAAQLQRFYTDSAAVCRIAGEDLIKAQGVAREDVAKTVGRTAVPATEDAIGALRKALSDTMAQISHMGENLDAVSKNADEKIVALATRERTKAPAANATLLRRELGEALAALDDLPRTPISSVLRVLERTSAAIVIGPPGAAGTGRPGVTSVELSSIYPPKSPEGSGTLQVDLRAKTEELLAGAVSSLSRSDSPIVVFVHGKGVRMAPDYVPVISIVERMRLRGVDFAEWAAGIDNDPPALKSLDPQGKRPVVYIAISMAPDTAEDGARFAKLVKGIERLLADGKNVLLCEVPSTLPSIGQKDAMAEILTPLGVQVDSGRPLLKQASGPRGRIVTADLFTADPGTDHPIAKAINGLTLYLPWAMPVRIAEGAKGVRPVVMFDNQGKTLWAESEFLSFLQTPAAQQQLLTNPPEPGSSRDDPAGPWPVVVTVERSAAGKAQRVVVVGCNKWMAGDVMAAESEVQGRRVPTYAGNIELMDASVYWLAGQDNMISASPESQQVPLIPPLSEAQLNALRWGLIGVLPALILLLGAAWRLLRG